MTAVLYCTEAEHNMPYAMAITENIVFLDSQGQL